MPNRLQNEKSEYLLQHKDNPVDWFPWGKEAFEKSKNEDKPIFLSIGYSACHWCHVMEEESFEDQETADFLNKNFVSIKVDREERPDVDSVYMTSVQIIAGHGGWPMSSFLTPEGRPFFAGTYFPKEGRHGIPSFIEVLKKITLLYATKRNDIEKSSTEITEILKNQYENNKEEIENDENTARLYITPDQIGDSQPVLQDEVKLTFSGSTRFAKIMDIRTLKGGQEYLFRLRIVF